MSARRDTDKKVLTESLLRLELGILLIVPSTLGVSVPFSGGARLLDARGERADSVALVAGIVVVVRVLELGRVGVSLGGRDVDVLVVRQVERAAGYVGRERHLGVADRLLFDLLRCGVAREFGRRARATRKAAFGEGFGRHDKLEAK